MNKPTDNLVTLGLIFLGLILMLTPLALWVAWTETIFMVVLGSCATAAVLYCLLARLEAPASSNRSEASDPARAQDFSDTVTDELQSLHPFVHHHRPSGGRKFRLAMYRLKKRLYGEPG